MTRGLVAGLATPHPLGKQLPGLYQDDAFAQRFTSALDEVLAPVLNSIDTIEAYFDPGVAPDDFVDWLGSWLGLALDEDWPPERRRAFVAQASSLYAIRGTVRGLAEHLRLVTGGEVEIEESGGTAWSTTPAAGLPGRPGFEMVVRLRIDEPAAFDRTTLDAIVTAAKPAHVMHRVEIVGPRRQSRRQVEHPEQPPEDGSQNEGGSLPPADEGSPPEGGDGGDGGS
jgi:phage tail-like protein